MGREKKSRYSFDRLSDRYVYAILVAVCVASRVPFLGTFELVAYDGTYYLNQARTLFGSHMAGSFPIGYPFVVKLFQFVLRDYAVAGMAVSFAAGVGSAIIAYRLAKHFVAREWAFLAALTIALNPLMIRLSLMTLSESLYTFWVLLGLLMFVEKRWLPFGLAMGLAAITRPEALAIVGLLGLTRIRRPKQLAVIAVSFLAVYAVNSVVLSVNAGRAVVLPKSQFFGSSTAFWKMREATIDFEGKDDTMEQLASESPEQSAATDFFKRLLTELRLLLRYVLPVVFLLALFALRKRKYLFFTAALFSFFVIPLATVRSIDRYILPYIPVLILLAVFAAAEIRNRTARAVAAGLIAATILALPMVNKAALLVPVEPDMLPLKKAGLQFRGDVKPGDKVAGRKPFFAFYSGGDYVEIPVAPYEDVMSHFAGQAGVKYVVLHHPTVHNLRPAMRPLMYSKAVINGELRYRQVYFDPNGVMVFQRVMETDPLRWERVTPQGGADFAPAWSPDGRFIAFRSKTGEDSGGIYIIEHGGRRPTKVADASPLYDQLSWSPDGGRIAFAEGESGAADVYSVDVESRSVERIVSGGGDDMSPSWSPAGDEIVFSSDRGGQKDLWGVELATGELRRITTDGDNTHPAVSPSGEMIAWIKEDKGVVILHRPTGRRIQLAAPRLVRYAPTWSPDEEFLAVTAEDWGSWDIYLCKTDGTNALLLTKNPRRDAMPAWSPDGERIAVISDVGQKSLSIWTVGGLRSYQQHLDVREKVRVFDARATR